MPIYELENTLSAPAARPPRIFKLTSELVESVKILLPLALFKKSRSHLHTRANNNDGNNMVNNKK